MALGNDSAHNRPMHPAAAHHEHHAATTATAGPPAGRYVCPMHPNVADDVPGSCPVCGMALEPTAAAEESPELAAMTRRLVVSAVLTAPLLVLGMGGMATRQTFGAHLLAWMELTMV